MLVHVAPYLGDKDVALLFDSINGKLGMESNGQLRFRRLAQSAEGLDLQARDPRYSGDDGVIYGL